MRLDELEDVSAAKLLPVARTVHTVVGTENYCSNKSSTDLKDQVLKPLRNASVIGHQKSRHNS